MRKNITEALEHIERAELSPNEQKTLEKLLGFIKVVGFGEVIIVVNGSAIARIDMRVGQLVKKKDEGEKTSEC